MFLVTANPDIENLDRHNIIPCESPKHVEMAVNQLIKKTQNNRVCVWRLSETFNADYKEFSVRGFVHTEKGEILPK